MKKVFYKKCNSQVYNNYEEDILKNAVILIFISIKI